MSQIKRAITEEGWIRISAMDSRNIADQAQKIHNTTPVATAALGRTLTAAAFMGSMLKNETDSLTIYIKGDGPLGGIVATANGAGAVRGYVYQPLVDIPLKKNGKLDVSGAIGSGYLSVSRDLGLKEPYVGQVPLVTGEIAEDFTYYYAKSEQTPTSIGLGVLVDTDLSVKYSGGFLVQLMPDCDEEATKQLERNIAGLEPITTMFEKGMTSEDIAKKVLEGFSVKFLDEITYQYQCDCSLERINRALISLGREELSDIINTDGKAQLTCQFCPEIYNLSKEDLQNLLNSI